MSQGQIDYEELRERAETILCEGISLEKLFSGNADQGIGVYQQALQEYLSDKVVIPLEMIREARENGVGCECFLMYSACDMPIENDPLCRLCKLLCELTEAARGKE